MMATTRDENPARKTSPAFLWKDADLFTKPASEEKIKLHFLEDGVQRYIDAGIIAPRDEFLGGTFLAQNKYGVIAAVNNRENSPFKDDNKERIPDMRKMPRGGLPLDACSFKTADEAAHALWDAIKNNQKDVSRKYSGFNLVIADTKSAWVITNAKRGDITVDNETRVEYEDIGSFSLALWKVPKAQLCMLGGFDLNDLERSERTKIHLPALSALPLPQFDDLTSWHAWLNQMSYKHDEYRNDPFSKSICQPHPKLPASLNAGIPEWVTVATHLMLINDERQNWFGLEGQLVQGRLATQIIERNQPEQWAEVAFGPETLKMIPTQTSNAAISR